MTVLATFARMYVDDLDTALPVFRALTGEEPRLRFTHRGIELAAVGGFLLLAGAPEALAPVRATQATVVVDALGPVLDGAAREGAEILAQPRDVPTGRNLVVRHPGGAVIEYVEFDAATRAAAGLAY
ncbi:VOC family protein [Streptomyces sp. P6-2-1]|uniref:VOC family protein n=1 Tax=Streptomyces sp. P6-2-1 TaxID=3422591 RepID=UPI003D35D77D